MPSHEEALDELYVGTFDDFVARRDALAKRLKADGDAEGADAVRQRKKPNRVAWALNQLSAGTPELRDELLSAGEALRAAQEQLTAGDGDRTRVREAQERERSAVGQAARAAAELAEQDGAPLSAAVTERLRDTLHAVALDEKVRDEFAAHRLTADHQASGLGPFSTGAPAPAPARKAKKGTKGKEPSPREKTAARKRAAAVAAAQKRLDEREHAEMRAREALDTARTRAERAQRALEEATADLEQATAETEAAASELRSLEEDA